MQRTHSTNARRAGGFTLIEMVIVIVLIGGILALVTSKIFGVQARQNYKLAEIQLKDTLAPKIEAYLADVGVYPESLEQLTKAPSNAVGWLGPYAKDTDFTDPWHHPIEYRQPGDNNAPYELISLGADGKPGGDGVDKDIVAP